MIQDSLFDLPLPPDPLMWQPGSDTSKAAAERAVAFADTQRARVLIWIQSRPEGSTQIECYVGTGIERHSLTFRFRELEKRLLIRKLDDERGGAHVYMVNG